MTEKETEFNKDLTFHQVTQADWDLADIALDLMTWFGRLNRYYFEGTLPHPVFSFNKQGKKTLGSFTLRHEGFGFKDNINLNNTYVDIPLCQKLVIMLTYMSVQWQQHDGNPGKAKTAFNDELIDKLEVCGLKYNKKKQLQEVTSNFLDYVAQFELDTEEIEGIKDIVSPTEKKKRSFYRCQCQKSEFFTTKKDLSITCNRCESLYEFHDPNN